jgi:hypothetical protein
MPGASAEQAEHVYAALAELCGVPVPPPGERIQQITFRHDGEDWQATVGRTLRGSRTDRRMRRGRWVDVSTRLSDPATVRAIFAGTPYKVVTDGRPLGEVISAWVNPFLAGERVGVIYFDPQSPPA